MIRVLHVINWLRRGGVETQLLQILREYDRSKFQMDVCCFGSEIGYLAPEASKYGTEILRCPKSANLYSFSKRFFHLLLKNNYDIVHCHSEAWSGPVLRAANLADVSLRISHIRSSLPQGFRIKNPLMKLIRNCIMLWGRYWLLKNATHVLGVSASALDMRFVNWRKMKHFHLWTLGVDTERFTPPDEKKEVSRTEPVIINVASFIPQRRHDILIDIFMNILKKIPGAKLKLVGAGEKFDACKILADNYDVNGQIEFLGLRDDIPDLLHGADIFLSCSEVEGLPNSIVEAQAIGLPVVASDIPPHREALPEKSHPFLFRSHDIQAATEKIIRIIDDPILYDDLSNSGRSHIMKFYDARDSFQRLQNNYIDWLNQLQISLE